MLVKSYFGRVDRGYPLFFSEGVVNLDAVCGHTNDIVWYTPSVPALLYMTLVINALLLFPNQI